MCFGRWVVAAVVLGLGLSALGAADPSADEQLLRQAEINPDGPSLLDYFRRRTLGEADRRRIEDLIRQLGDSSYAIRERASTELVAIGLPAVTHIRAALHHADIEIIRRAERCLRQVERVPSATIAAAAARLVGRQPPEGAVPVLLAFLPAADDEAVADEVRDALAAAGRSTPAADGVLEKALADALPIRRAAAAEALVRTGRPGAIAAARKALTDADPDVRLRVAMALVTYGKDKAAVPALIGLLGELPHASCWRIEELLLRLAGDHESPATLGADETSRLRCRDAWLAWWQAHATTADLSRLEGTPALLGYTLLVLRDPRGGLAGRVVEVNARQEVLWTIEALQQPLDAVMLSKDRVLIAEHQGNQVTERDLSGRVLWSKAVYLPVAVQRLPEGHVLIAGRKQVVELDGKRAEVFSHSREQQQDITAAVKTRGGEYVFMTRTGHCVRVDAKGRQLGTFATPRLPQSYGTLEALPNGRILLTQNNAVVEYDAEGRSQWQTAVSQPTSAQRLPNGNTLVCTTAPQRVFELDRKGQTVWEYRPPDAVPWKAKRR